MYNKNLNGVCTLPNGKLIIAVENNLKIYDVAKKNTEKTFTGHVKPILCVCPTFQGNILSAG